MHEIKFNLAPLMHCKEHDGFVVSTLLVVVEVVVVMVLLEFFGQ
jgi:hypothetical protein